MKAEGKPKVQAPRRLARPAPAVSTAGKWAIWLSILGMVGVLTLVGLLVARSSRRAQAPVPPTPRTAPQPKAPTGPDTPRPPDKEDEEWIKRYTPPESPATPPRRPLRVRIEAEYEAAKQRAELHTGKSRWGEAIAAYEKLLDRYDDHELQLRCDEDLVELRRRAKQAFKARIAEADKLLDAGRTADARKALDGIAASFGIEDFTAQAKERIKQLDDRTDADAAASFAAAMAAVDARLPAWQFEAALADAQKLQFDRPQHKELHARRVQRLQELVALKIKIIERITRGTPRLDKRATGVPGLPGELTVATAECIHTMTKHGEEKIPWARLGPDGAARLALLAGDAKDPKHVLAVARLLVELGHLARARQELEQAKALGVATAADEADLARRQPPAPPPKK